MIPHFLSPHKIVAVFKFEVHRGNVFHIPPHHHLSDPARPRQGVPLVHRPRKLQQRVPPEPANMVTGRYAHDRCCLFACVTDFVIFFGLSPLFVLPSSARSPGGGRGNLPSLFQRPLTEHRPIHPLSPRSLTNPHPSGIDELAGTPLEQKAGLRSEEA